MVDIDNSIINITGRKVTECQCKKCQEYCQVPCLGTPYDILRLIKNGYADKLTMGCFKAIEVKVDDEEGLRVRHQEETYLIIPKKTDKGCIFFSNGKCELHEKGLKPLAGKLYHHTVDERMEDPLRSIEYTISVTWKFPGFKGLVEEIFILMSVLSKKRN